MSGTLYRSDGATWEKVLQGPPGSMGTGAMLIGLQADRPAAAAVAAGQTYFASDTLMLWRSDAIAWTLVSATAKRVTSLPASPVDGQQILLEAEPGTRTMWHFRYNAGATGLYKWEFMGGADFGTQQETSFNTASTTYVAANGPNMTLPCAGVYLVESGFTGRPGPVGGIQAFMSYGIDGATALDADSVSQDAGGTNISVWKKKKKTFTSPNPALITMAKSPSGNSIFLDRVYMWVRPVQVG